MRLLAQLQDFLQPFHEFKNLTKYYNVFFPYMGIALINNTAISFPVLSGAHVA